MTVYIIQPTGITWAAWSAQMAQSLAAYGNVPIMPDQAQWQRWGNIVVGFPAIAALVAPRPQAFSTWQDWVRAFNQAVSLLE